LKPLPVKLRRQGGDLSKLTILDAAPEISAEKGYFILGCDDYVGTFWKEVLRNIAEVPRVGNAGDAARAEIANIINAALASMPAVFQRLSR
jgi:hypothetical protein